MRLQLNHSKEICVSHYILATALALTWATRLLAVEPGAAHGWGTWYKLPETRGVIDFIDVKASSDYTIGLRSDGTVVVWGVDNSGVISFLPNGLTNVVAIAAGEFMPMALTSEGRVRVWGTGGHVYSSAILNVHPAATNVIAIAGGSAHCLALRADP